MNALWYCKNKPSIFIDELCCYPRLSNFSLSSCVSALQPNEVANTMCGYKLLDRDVRAQHL